MSVGGDLLNLLRIKLTDRLVSHGIPQQTVEQVMTLYDDAREFAVKELRDDIQRDLAAVRAKLESIDKAEHI